MSYSAAVALGRRGALAFVAAAFFGLAASVATGGLALASDFAADFAAALPDACLRPAARRPFGKFPIMAARASSRTMASSSVTVSGVLSPVSVALTPLWLA